MGLKFAVYSRKSKFSEKGDSIENQIEMCRQYIKVHFPEADDNDILIFEDEGFSGGNIDRPQFKRMMEAGQSRQLKAVICYRLDRISRNIGDFAKLIEEFGCLNIAFVSIKEQFDTSSPLGKAMMFIASVFSQLERETIAERIRDNMHELAKTGRWLGGTAPTGYRSMELVEKVTVDGKVRKACRLELIDDEAELVKRIFSRFIKVNSLTKVETWLMQNNIVTKNGKTFTRFSIKNILRNPVYMIADKDAWRFFKEYDVDIYAEEAEFDGKHGIMAYNKTMQASGKSNKVRDMDEWIIAVGRHKGLICGADWTKVQNMLFLNRSKDYRKPRSHVALLPGLLFCGNCGDAMRPKLGHRVDEAGERVFSYLCETKEKSCRHHCDIKNPNGNALDLAVCTEIKKLSEDSSVFLEQLNNAERMVKKDTRELDGLLNELQNGFRANEKEISALVTSLAKTDGTAAHSYITAQINELHEKNAEIKARMEELQNLTQANVLSDIQFELIRDILVSFGQSFELMGVEQKRAALRVFIKRIEWDGENVHVYLFGSDDDNNDIMSISDEALCAASGEGNSKPLGGNSK
jgi:site-specific DNA recombinase